MKPLLIGIAVGCLLSWSSYARADQPTQEPNCTVCQENYKECYKSARQSRLSCGRQCSGMLKLIRSARDAQGLMDAGQLVCADGAAPTFDFEGTSLEEVQADYAECKSGCTDGFIEARAGCREQRTVCLASCTH